MSTTTQIRKSEDVFKAVHRSVEALAQKFNFSVEDAWKVVCDTPVESLQRKFKRERRRNNPYASVKKPRTAFSFYTKNNRADISSANPNATFGELSKLVSESWNKLSDKARQKYKTMESDDRKRYQQERDAVTERLASEETTVSASTESSTEAPVAAPVKTAAKKSSGKRAAKTTSTKASRTTKSTTSVGSYNVYQKQMRADLKKQHPKLSSKDLNSKLGEMWLGLSDTEKSQYVAA